MKSRYTELWYGGGGAFYYKYGWLNEPTVLGLRNQQFENLVGVTVSFPVAAIAPDWASNSNEPYKED